MEPNYKIPLWIISDHVYQDREWSNRTDVQKIELKSVLRALDVKLNTFFGVPDMAVGFLELVKSFVGSFVMYQYIVMRVQKLVSEQKKDLKCHPILVVLPAIMIPRLSLACQKHIDGTRVKSFTFAGPSDDDLVDSLPW